MPDDLSKYRHHVEQFDLSDEQKADLLRTVYSMMQSAVDRAYGHDSAQLAMEAGDVIDLNVGEYRVAGLVETFNDKKGTTTNG